MTNLTPHERELVALGAAIGGNCVPCVEYHILEAKKAGLSDAQIRAAIDLADAVRKVPAQKVLDAAMRAIGGSNLVKGEENEVRQCANINSVASQGCC